MTRMVTWAFRVAVTRSQCKRIAKMWENIEAPTNTEARKKENVLKNFGTSTFFPARRVREAKDRRLHSSRNVCWNGTPKV